MFVVDASVTLSWCFEDETSAASDALLRRLLLEGGVVPAHWPLEVANGLRSAERRGRLDPERLDDARTVLTALPINVTPVGLDTAFGVLELARSLELSVYDAAYLDLAQTRGLRLATADVRLAAACRTVGIQLIG